MQKYNSELLSSMRGRTITEPYPYVMLQDLRDTTRQLAPDISDDRTSKLEAQLGAILELYAPEQSTFYQVAAHELSEGLDTRTKEYVDSCDGRVGVVCLDKDLLKDFDGAIFRLQFSRSPYGELVSRRGTAASPEDQKLALAAWMQEGDYDTVAVVDDVLAFGETTGKIVTLLQEVKPDVSIQYIVGITSRAGAFEAVTYAIRKRDANLTKESITLAQSVGSLLIGSVLLFINGGVAFVSVLTPIAVAAMLVLGAIYVGIGYLITYGMRHYSLSMGSVVLSSDLIFALAINALAIAQYPTLPQIVGSLILFGCIIYTADFKLNWRRFERKDSKVLQEEPIMITDKE